MTKWIFVFLILYASGFAQTPTPTPTPLPNPNTPANWRVWVENPSTTDTLRAQSFYRDWVDQPVGERTFFRAIVKAVQEDGTLTAGQKNTVLERFEELVHPDPDQGDTHTSIQAYVRLYEWVPAIRVKMQRAAQLIWNTAPVGKQTLRERREADITTRNAQAVDGVWP